MRSTARKTRNAQEVAELVEGVAHMLARGARKFEAKRFVIGRLGCTPRSAENYITRARALLREAVGKDREGLRCESYGFYISIIRNPDASNRDRMLAQMAIDSLMGLRDPVPPRGREQARVRAWSGPVIERVREEAADILARGEGA